MTKELHIISLGAGVQSSTMALMASRKEIAPMPEAAIFADTGDEPGSVYQWLEWLEKQLPFPIVKVKANRQTLSEYALERRLTIDGRRYFKGMVPVTLLSPSGTKGMAWRTCTADFKIAPLRKKSKELLASFADSNFCQCESAGERVTTSPIDICDTCKQCGHIINDYAKCVTWIGISLDEAHRMKMSRDAWCEMRWPLIDLRMTRNDCLRWMEKHGYPRPPRSACVYCPFHSDAEWRRLKTQEPSEFLKAVEFEKQLQSAAEWGEVLKGKPFLHNSCVPLGDVDFSTEEQRGQINLFGNECEGMCGV